MFLDPADRFLVPFFTGLGLMLIAATSFCLQRQGSAWRAGVTGALLVALVAGFACFRDWSGATRVALALSLALGLGLLAAAEWFQRTVGAILRCLTRPPANWLTLGVVGLLVVAASVQVADHLEGEAADIAQITSRAASLPPRVTDAGVCAFTDTGSPIPLSHAVPGDEAEVEGYERAFLGQSAFRGQLLWRGPAHHRANCHGWVFTGGRFWLPGEAVEQILQENAYRRVLNPRCHDLVVYREGDAVCHTAVVSYVTRGMPVLVEGKWGPLGTYLHAVDQSSYGTDYTYYRSRRAGHLLLGLPGESEPLTTSDVAAE